MKRSLLPAGPDAATRRRILFGSTLGVAALLVLALVVIVNYLAFRHYQRWDWTRSELYTLSEKTKSIVEGLDRDVSVIVFMDEQTPVYEPTRELLSRYAAATPKIEVTYVDPVRNPARAQQLMEKYQQRAAVVFESGADKRVVDPADLADYDYSAMQTGGGPEMKGFKGEQKFTSAIVELVEAKKPSLLFTTGHGEPSLDDFEGRGFGRLQQFLGTDNFAIEEWASLGKTAVPPNTDLVVVAGPKQPFIRQELDALSRFLQGGGRVLVMVDPNLSEAAGRVADTGLAEWLGSWGIKAQEDIVVDPSNLLPFFSAETIFAANYGTHPIVDTLRQAKVPVVFALARSVAAGTAPPDATLTELVRTSADGWGETDLANLTQVAKGDGDLPGPVSLGIALELNAEKPASPLGEEGLPAPAPTPAAASGPKGRMVVYGDSDFATNAELDKPGNATLIANTLNWMVERETHLGIAPKEPEQVHLSLTPQERRLNFWLVVFGLPGAALAAGIAVTVRRRR